MFRHPIHKMSKKKTNFFLTLTQRGNMDGKRTQPVVEVFAQLLLKQCLL